MNKFILFVAFAVLSACNLVDVKNSGNETDPLGTIPSFPATETEFTQYFHSSEGHTWTADGFLLAGTSGFLDCRLDDRIILKANTTNPLSGTYEYNGGDDLCGAEDDKASKFGTYQINYESKTIIFDAGTNNESTAKVSGLDEEAIVLEGEYMGLTIRGKYLISN